MVWSLLYSTIGMQYVQMLLLFSLFHNFGEVAFWGRALHKYNIPNKGDMFSVGRERK